jgi:hypothetical protein
MLAKHAVSKIKQYRVGIVRKRQRCCLREGFSQRVCPEANNKRFKRIATTSQRIEANVCSYFAAQWNIGSINGNSVRNIQKGIVFLVDSVIICLYKNLSACEIKGKRSG